MGASGTDNFCLRWNDFAENVSGAFKELRSESDFFDVTLACTDSGSRTLQAHKVILSACSNFFKSTFRQQTNANKHPNPYIYLRGVTYNDLNSILDFIYNGEVNVAQEELNSFLAVAEELQIKGLTNRDSKETTSNNAGASESPSGQSTSTSAAGTPRKSSSSGATPGARPRSAQATEQPPVKKFRKSSPAPTASIPIVPKAQPQATIEIEPDEVKEVVNIKDDPEVLGLASTSAVNPDEAGQEFGGEDYDESYDGYYEDDGAEMGDGAEGTDGTKGQSKSMDIEQGGPGPNDHFALRFVKTQDGELTYQCGLCGYLPNSTNKSIGYAKNRVCMHIKNVHSEPTNVVCKGCSKKFKNKESLRVHKIKYCREQESAGPTTPVAAIVGQVQM